jgi:hypothetical protein
VFAWGIGQRLGFTVQQKEFLVINKQAFLLEFAGRRAESMRQAEDIIDLFIKELYNPDDDDPKVAFNYSQLRDRINYHLTPRMIEELLQKYRENGWDAVYDENKEEDIQVPSFRIA